MRLPALLCLLTSTPLAAEIAPVPYADLQRELSNTITFETLPQRPEPGFNLDHPIRVSGAWLGEHFAGQSLRDLPAKTGVPHDALGHPFGHRPLAIRPGKQGQNLSVAFHRGFDSNAVLPLGPQGFHRISGRGEGALAILFDSDQWAFGFRLHTDYARPLGNASDRGEIHVHTFTRQGYPLDQTVISPPDGISEHGFRVTDGPLIGGILITNSDPGGVALDDILFQIDLMLF